MELALQRWHVQIYLRIVEFQTKILQWLIEKVSYIEAEIILSQWKSAHAIETKHRTLEEAIKGADVFLGLSAKGVLSKADGKRHG